MRVKAKYWLKYDGTWYRGGDEFEIALTDADMLGDAIEIAETPVSGEGTVKTVEPVKRGRKKKVEE